MNDFEIISYSGVGIIKLGMTPEQVRAALKSDHKSFMKTQFSEMPTDAFGALGIHACYKKPGICEAIELFKPAMPTFSGHTLIGEPFDHTYEWLGKMDEALEADGAGLTSSKFGIGLYAPFAKKQPHEPIEAVIVFEKGYYGKKG